MIITVYLIWNYGIFRYSCQNIIHEVRQRKILSTLSNLRLHINGTESIVDTLT